MTDVRAVREKYYMKQLKEEWVRVQPAAGMQQHADNNWPQRPPAMLR